MSFLQRHREQNIKEKKARRKIKILFGYSPRKKILRYMTHSHCKRSSECCKCWKYKYLNYEQAEEPPKMEAERFWLLGKADGDKNYCFIDYDKYDLEKLHQQKRSCGKSLECMTDPATSDWMGCSFTWNTVMWSVHRVPAQTAEGQWILLLRYFKNI